MDGQHQRQVQSQQQKQHQYQQRKTSVITPRAKSVHEPKGAQSPASADSLACLLIDASVDDMSDIRDEWEIGDRIGEGTFSVVWLARKRQKPCLQAGRGGKKTAPSSSPPTPWPAGVQANIKARAVAYRASVGHGGGSPSTPSSRIIVKTEVLSQGNDGDNHTNHGKKRKSRSSREGETVKRAKREEDAESAAVLPEEEAKEEAENDSGVSSEQGGLFALKRISAISSPSRVITEIASLRLLGGSHHVVKLCEFFRTGDRVTLVLPYFQHQHFKEYYKIMSFMQIRAYMRALFEALQHLHSHQMIHR